jgi:hypothetical protein
VAEAFAPVDGTCRGALGECPLGGSVCGGGCLFYDPQGKADSLAGCQEMSLIDMQCDGEGSVDVCKEVL